MKNEHSILVVDDDPLAVRAIFDALGSQFENYHFIQANTGSIAEELALQRLPRLVITDWEMPGMSGTQLIRQLKNHPQTADIPVLMATGVMTSSENLRTAMEAGANDFIRKPIDAVELQARANNLIAIAEFVDEIKQMNLVINDTNRFLENLLNLIPYPLMYYDSSGTLLNYNQSFAETFSATLAQHNTYYELFDGTSALLNKQYDQEILSRKMNFVRYECRVTFANETNHDFVFTKVPVWDNNSELIGILGILGDLTELKREYESDLLQKKNELANISIRLVQNSQLNEKLMKDVQQLKESDDPKARKLAANIEKNYRLAMNKSLWFEFEKRFNEVHINFYNKLSNIYRDLTPNERKLCAFLKMGLSTKEIAAITFQNAKSIDMARYRLRKKLCIANNESFPSFLSRFG
ncbi:hypothetical protein MASR2M12_08110 [Bacteroidales bacterium]